MLAWVLTAATLAAAAGSAAALNFTLVDSTVPGTLTIMEMGYLGYHLAVMDAQNHVDGLFPDHDVALIDRTVASDEPTNPLLLEEVVTAMREDNAVAFMGGLLDNAFVVHGLLEYDNMPQAGFSPIKHLPTGTEIRDFGALADLRAQAKAIARLLLDNGINTVTLINTPEQTFLIYALFFELEFPNFGVRVHQKLLFEEGGAGDVMDQVLESDIRVFFSIARPPDLEKLLVAAEERNMTKGGYAWFAHTTSGIEAYVSPPYNAFFPDLTRLVAETKLIGTTLHEVNASSPAVQALRERAKDLPAIPSAPNYNVSRDGVSSWVASGYDTGMAMLRAVNRAIAAGGSPYDREAVIAEMKATNYEGLMGHMEYIDGGYGGLLHDVVFRQFTGASEAGATFATVREYNARTDQVVYSAVEWNTDDGLPPPNFSPDSCGVLFARIRDGTCVPCGAGMLNDPTDGVEVCAFCDDGSELQGEACVPCGEGEDSVRLDSGEPVCRAKSSDGTSWAVVAAIVVGSVVGTALLVAVVAGVYRKVERTREEIAQHRAKAQQAQFLGFSFHEMRNPLNVVSGALEFAAETIKRLAKEEGNRDLAPVLKDLRCGQHSLVDTVHVLDTINMLSQIIHGVVAAEMQPTCPKELAREVLTVAREVHTAMLAHEADKAAEEGQGGEEGGEEEGGKDEEDGEDEEDSNSKGGAAANASGADVLLDAVVMMDGVEIKSREFFVAMDRQKMRQALLILVINALKYTAKGKVVVEIRMSRQSRLDGGAALGMFGNKGDQDGRHSEPVVVRVCVRDTGSGMPPEDLEHIFDLDYQTKHGSVRSTGLGLVLAHRIVGMHGGELKVRSVHGTNAEVQGQATGTRFSWSMHTHVLSSGSQHASTQLWLARNTDRHGEACEKGGATELELASQRGSAQPIALFADNAPNVPDGLLLEVSRPNSLATNSSAGHLADMVQSMPSNLRVLLMEDVKLNRVFMKRKLATYPFSELGWVVEEVETGEQCLELIVDKGAQFDVVFCDQILSNAGGKLLGNEVAKRLREHEEHTNAEKRMVLIACSGNASDEDRKLYLESGMDGVVAKPLPSQKALFKFLHPMFVHEV